MGVKREHLGGNRSKITVSEDEDSEKLFLRKLQAFSNLT